MGEPAAALSWNFACPDWVERLKAGKSLLPPLPLNDNEANRAVAIFNNLRLPDVPGQPLMADAAGEWGRDIVRAIFGSMVDGERQAVIRPRPTYEQMFAREPMADWLAPVASDK